MLGNRPIGGNALGGADQDPPRVTIWAVPYKKVKVAVGWTSTFVPLPEAPIPANRAYSWPIPKPIRLRTESMTWTSRFPLEIPPPRPYIWPQPVRTRPPALGWIFTTIPPPAAAPPPPTVLWPQPVRVKPPALGHIFTVVPPEQAAPPPFPTNWPLPPRPRQVALGWVSTTVPPEVVQTPVVPYIWPQPYAKRAVQIGWINAPIPPVSPSVPQIWQLPQPRRNAALGWTHSVALQATPQSLPPGRVMMQMPAPRAKQSALLTWTSRVPPSVVAAIVRVQTFIFG